MASKVMMSCQGIAKSYGYDDLFYEFDFAVNEGEQIGLIGANGVGKSTLLRILAGQIAPDQGAVVVKQGLWHCYLEQNPVFDESLTVTQHLYQHLKTRTSFDESEIEKKVSKGLFETNLEDKVIGHLSGGQKKRLAIVSQWLEEPELWLLDEPTNHLDFMGVVWLQSLLKRGRLGFLIVSHDRYFLDQVVSKVVELSPAYVGGFLSFDCGYSAFIEKREAYFEAAAKEAQTIENKLRKEDEWMARQPKARSTKAQFRIDQVLQLRSNLGELRGRLKQKAQGYAFSSRDRKTKKLIELEKLSIGFETPLIEDLDMMIGPNEIIGVVGPNGTGKTTLLEAIYQEKHILKGAVSKVHDLRVVYFDQKRLGLDPEDDLRTALQAEADSVVYHDKLVHINAWAQMLGFDRERLYTKVSQLSGGEKARVLLSHVLRQKADVLILDEPTNDLDIESLELLEQNMVSFDGAVILITHDRYLLSHVCDRVVGFLGEGVGKVYAGYEQWQKEFLEREQLGTGRRKTQAVKDPSQSKDKKQKAAAGSKKGKLSYMLQREYDGMEKSIHEAEEALAALEEQAEKVAGSDPQRAHEAYEAVHAARLRLDGLYDRWAELEALSEGS